MSDKLYADRDDDDCNRGSVSTDYVSVYVNEFTESSAKNFFDSFKQAAKDKQKVVPVFIDSYGGNCDSLMNMLDVMISFPGKVATICVGKAMSCGVVLLGCGTKGMRYAAPNSRIMMHHVSSVSWGKVPETEAYCKEIKRLQEQIFHILSKRCGQRKSFYLNLLKNQGNTDVFMTPLDAFKYRIIDHVKYPLVKQEIIKKVIIE